jgi:hypothetical protein
MERERDVNEELEEALRHIQIDVADYIKVRR